MSSSVLPPLSVRASAITGSAIRDLLTLTARPDILSLAGGLPSPDVMPHSTIRDVTHRILSGSTAALQYAETTGVRRLRDVIAARESALVHDEVPSTSVVVTHGSQQALSLLASVLVDPGDVVVVDRPVYPGALQAFQAVGARIESVPVDADGTDTDALERLLESGVRPRAVHTVSNFHNPRGGVLSVGRRRALVDLAERYGFWVVDDDPYGDVWFDAPPPGPIASDRVIRLGSASKILAPSLRVGWLTAPRPVCDAVERIKQSADLCGSSLTQLVAADLLADETWLRQHLDDVRAVYSARAEVLVGALSSELGSAIEVDAARGGMFLWVQFTDGTDTSALLPAALDRGVAYVPGRAFDPADGDELGTALRVCFATSTEAELQEAVRRLAAAHDAR
ncbi:PLP-dependent aminotransferase family protein [Rhodococcus sp. SORGH_AS_0303]|uniref:aminotransferase-like domain-containing protein n=1 Tax=Rhodococcus sp. SORGH_AS_0303 TaxID=3041753 RepID=UPI00277F1289|nr:PLP-dependent aminotransferase family protein [Rhodococcus sp. SORGH_AS_0303]MDQ1202132.1 2-aminoadipate transaminase [Rhodococcus sp. SORGH_AS_0303]